MGLEPYFAYFGMFIAALIAVAILGFCVVVALVAWQEYGPEIHCRKPRSRMVLSTYRGDITDGEGKPIKCAPDISVTKLIGTSWKLKFFFGLMLFGKVE
jgi:hypothetical protein